MIPQVHGGVVQTSEAALLGRVVGVKGRPGDRRLDAVLLGQLAGDAFGAVTAMFYGAYILAIWRSRGSRSISRARSPR